MIALDIETIPDPDLPEELRPIPKPGNTKDPAKLKAKLAEYIESGKQAKAMATNPFMNKIVCVSTVIGPHYWVASICKMSEKELLEQVYNVLIANQFPIITGCNVRKFDMPTIHFRMLMNGMKDEAGVIWRRYLDHKAKHTNIQDLWDYFPGENYGFGMPLGFLAPRILGEPKGDGASRIQEWVDAGKWDDIEQYCLQDSRQEYQIAEWLGLV